MNKHKSNIKTSWTHCTVIHWMKTVKRNKIYKKKYFPSLQPNFESNLHHMLLFYRQQQLSDKTAEVAPVCLMNCRKASSFSAGTSTGWRRFVVYLQHSKAKNMVNYSNTDLNRDKHSHRPFSPLTRSTCTLVLVLFL